MADKTEQPTAKRLREARKKGQIPRSQDFTQAFLFLTAAVVLSTGGVLYINEFKSLMVQFFQPEMMTGVLPGSILIERTGSAWARFLLLTAPLLGALMIASAAISFLQVRAVYAADAVKPSFAKLNPMKGLQNIFATPKTYIELAKNILKFVIIGFLCWSTIHSQLHDVLLTSRVGLSETAMLGSRLLFSLLFKVGAVFLIFGGVDYMIQRHLIMKQLMMSKEEVTREYKQDEGDPHIKHQRRHLHREMLQHNVASAVKKAKVVVVNPTHLAIAIEYEDATMAAPLIAMKGEDSMAARIIDLAKEYDVPIMRNVPLAHSLYPLEIGTEIPEELYEAVAEVLNWVYGLTQLEEE